MLFVNLLLLPLVLNNSNPAPLVVSDDINETWNYTREFHMENRDVALGSCVYDQYGLITSKGTFTFSGYIGFDSASSFELYIETLHVYYDNHVSTSNVTISYGVDIPINSYFDTSSLNNLNNYRFTYVYVSNEDDIDIDISLYYNNDEIYNSVQSLGISAYSITTSDTSSISFNNSTGNDDFYPSFAENIGQQILGILYGNVDLYGQGYDLGYTTGYNEGEAVGYGNGFTDGFDDGSSMDTTALVVFNGILNIAMIPINFFLSMFNFEVLGINITSLMTALLSVAVAIIIVRFVTGKKQEGDK